MFRRLPLFLLLAACALLAGKSLVNLHPKLVLISTCAIATTVQLKFDVTKVADN